MVFLAKKVPEAKRVAKVMPVLRGNEAERAIAATRANREYPDWMHRVRWALTDCRYLDADGDHQR